MGRRDLLLSDIMYVMYPTLPLVLSPRARVCVSSHIDVKTPLYFLVFGK